MFGKQNQALLEGNETLELKKDQTFDKRKEVDLKIDFKDVISPLTTHNGSKVPNSKYHTPNTITDSRNNSRKKSSIRSHKSYQEIMASPEMKNFRKHMARKLSGLDQIKSPKVKEQVDEEYRQSLLVENTDEDKEKIPEEDEQQLLTSNTARGRRAIE